VLGTRGVGVRVAVGGAGVGGGWRVGVTATGAGVEVARAIAGVGVATIGVARRGVAVAVAVAPPPAPVTGTVAASVVLGGWFSATTAITATPTTISTPPTTARARTATPSLIAPPSVPSQPVRRRCSATHRDRAYPGWQLALAYYRWCDAIVTPQPVTAGEAKRRVRGNGRHNAGHGARGTLAMYQSDSYYRRDSLTNHPPYGLYLDPHRGEHNWTVASTRVVLGFVTVIGSIMIVVALGPH
jgi:hypothetical protein